MDPLENPYRPGAGTAPPALAGRKPLIDEFKLAVARAVRGKPGKSLIPTGLRGVGKTVLLKRFAVEAGDAGAHVASLEASENGAFLAQLSATVRSLLLGLDRLGAASEAIHRALRVLKSFSLTLPGDVRLGIAVEPEVGYADSGSLARDLIDVFVATGQAAAARGSCAVVAIDELQYVEGAELGALIMALHRTTQEDLPIVLVATGLPQLPAVAGDAKSYAERLFAFPRIGQLDAHAAREAIELPSHERGVTFEPEAIKMVVERTGGYPYFLQEWAHDAWNRGVGNRIAAMDIHAIQGDVEERLDRDFFSVRFDRLTPQERSYLRALAEFGTSARSGQIAARLGRAVASVAPLRDTLIRKGMLYSPAHGLTAYTVPLFDEFMKRAAPTLPMPRLDRRAPRI